jgi:hypothetical protein
MEEQKSVISPFSLRCFSPRGSTTSSQHRHLEFRCFTFALYETGSMDDWLIDATTTALERMKEHAELVGLANTDEATFRAFFMEALKRMHRSATFKTEWRRFDLLVRLSGSNALVEFKYYLRRPKYDLEGKQVGWKGGAGPKNESEFLACRNKLHGYAEAAIQSRYLVLVYQRQIQQPKDYEASYGALCVNEQFEVARSIEIAPFACKILRICSFEQ